MLTSILNRLAIPAIIFLVGMTAGIFLQQRIFDKPCRLECPKVPDCNCPKPELQSIDFEKVKGFKGTINLNQHYTVQVESDSALLVTAINDAVRNNLPVAKRK